MLSLDCSFVIYVRRYFATREMNNKVTLSRQHKEFAAPVTYCDIFVDNKLRYNSNALYMLASGDVLCSQVVLATRKLSDENTFTKRHVDMHIIAVIPPPLITCCPNVTRVT